MTESADILVIGDSVLAWNGAAKASIGEVAARQTNQTVLNLSVPGARLSHRNPDAARDGHDIRAQYRPGAWGWVILNGGANDLLSECGCRQCRDNLNGLIAADGQSGDMVDLVRRVRADGARVIVLGYYDGNAKPNPFQRCQDETDVLNARLAQLAQRTPGVIYVDAGDVIDPDTPAHWFLDRVHPSRQGSARIGALVAAAMAAAF
ncbi:MAG: SGNH/GDSL hydrolase family protein [Sedimentitalea sp.]